jgi:exonuclease SbcD
VKLLLFSDVVLDRPYEWATPSLANARRAAARESLVELLGVARSQDVDVIACAGDLFDRRTVRPATMQWLTAAFRSADAPVLIAPGNRDFIGPLGGYQSYDWPENVIVFDEPHFEAVEVADGVTIWGAAHTEAHRGRSFFAGFEVDRDGVNFALLHATERSGLEREQGLDACALFDESEVEGAGFDHALVGHFQQAHLGWTHTYAGAPITHAIDHPASNTAVLVTLAPDGSIEREEVELSTPQIADVEVDLTDVSSTRDVVKRVNAALAGWTGATRLRLTGRVAPELVLQREDLGVASTEEVLVEWAAGVDVDVDALANEPTVRGQFVRDVLASGQLDDARRDRVLLMGLRALAGTTILEGPR